MKESTIVNMLLHTSNIPPPVPSVLRAMYCLNLEGHTYLTLNIKQSLHFISWQQIKSELLSIPKSLMTSHLFGSPKPRTF